MVHPLGNEWPHEGFVQAAIEEHFSRLGYRKVEAGHTDYVGVHPETKGVWVIEAKGETKDNIGVDFQTGLGQLLFKMHESNARYGIAVPETKRFLTQLTKVPSRVRQLLGLHWLMVDEIGKVRCMEPSENLPGDTE